MSKTGIKNSATNELIVALVDTYACIICKQGVRCKQENTDLNNIMQELKSRGLLTDDNIEFLNR